LRLLKGRSTLRWWTLCQSERALSGHSSKWKQPECRPSAPMDSPAREASRSQLRRSES
jgi:hypothetical protein